MDYFKIVLLLCWAVLIAGFFQGLFFPANRDKAKSPRQVIQLTTGSKVFWVLTQGVYLIVLKVIIALLMTKLGYEVNDGFIIPGPALILNVGLTYYLIYNKNAVTNRYIIGLLLMIAQVLLGLITDLNI